MVANYDEVMKLALERGFYFPSCEIYSDAPAGFWEYGPRGVNMKNKFIGYAAARALYGVMTC